MKHNTIKLLLDRYFAGESSLEEEQQLRQYFQQDDIAPDLLQYQPLFRFLVHEKQQHTSTQFNQRLNAAPAPLHVRSRRPVYQWAVAASMSILLALAGYLLHEQTVAPLQTASVIDWSQYEPKTDAEALLITQKALSRTSKAMQQGLFSAQDELENIQQVLQPFK